MTDYIPGRLYSGVVYNKRKRLVRIHSSYIGLWFDMELGYLDEGEVTDVRGPLVVLDLDVSWPDICNVLRRHLHTVPLAEQIEEQTRPAPERGWHEVEEVPRPAYFDGHFWSYIPGSIPTGSQDLTSVHYIGPASGDSDD